MNVESDVNTKTSTKVSERVEVVKNDLKEMIKVNEIPENDSEACVVVENGNEVITIVAQESDGQIYIYDRNEEVENTSEIIDVCGSGSALDSNTDLQKKNVCIDLSIDENNKNLESNTKIMQEETESVCEGQITKNQDVKVVEVNTVNEKLPLKPNENKIINYKKICLEDWEVSEDYENEKPADYCEDLTVGGKLKIPENTASVVKADVTDSIAEGESMISENVEVVEESEVVENVQEAEVSEHNQHVSGAQELKVTENFTLIEEPNIIEEIVTLEEINSSNEKSNNEERVVTHPCETANESGQNDSASLNEIQINDSASIIEGEILNLMSDSKVDSLKYSKSISKNDIVKLLDESKERVVKPIVTGKDLFFSIELTKRLNQKLNQSLIKGEAGEKKILSENENETCNNNNAADDRQKIVEILEADEIKDWKSVPSKSDVGPKENGNDMEISNAIKSMEASNATEKEQVKPPKRTSLKKFKIMDKELERSIALQQLREEFPSTRKRIRTTKKVNHIPFLASTVLEKALTSPEVSTALKPGLPKRRPCYLPDKSDAKIAENSEDKRTNVDEDQITASKSKKHKSHNEADSTSVIDITENTSISSNVVKTYSVKRKSTDAENNIKSTLETLAAVTRALSQSEEENVDEFKPKKQKTVIKLDNKTPKKVNKKKSNIKTGSGKRNLELEKLLGDEGAVRMLYDAQHKESASTTPKRSKMKTTTGLKKDLVLKTKLVKNAVMRLSGLNTEGVYLRGKRLSKITKQDIENSEPLFASTPNIILYKPKKKQRAEASRILYRHSSSESFDSSEGYRRTSFEADSLNVTTKEGSVVNEDRIESSDFSFTKAEKVPPKSNSSNKSEIMIKKRLNRLSKAKLHVKNKKLNFSRSRKESENSVKEIQATNSAKLNLSNVPVRKSSRPRTVSKKYSIWSSTSMDSLSVESLGLKKLKKASPELGKKLNCREWSVLQYEHLVQLILNPVSTLLKNSLNIQVLEELKFIINFLTKDDSCKAVLISSTGNTFCQGIDINLVLTCSEDERKNSLSQLVKIIGELSTCLSDFKKPLIAGVQGSAIGLGVTLLPYCDLVIASDKASFYTPYAKLGQAPEGGATYTFPRINKHLVSELLFLSHKMTAADAYKYGLVTRVISEERFEEELIIFARNMASHPSQGVQSIKFLLENYNRNELSEALKKEGEKLEKHWTNSECLNNLIKFFNSGELQLNQSDHT